MGKCVRRIIGAVLTAGVLIAAGEARDRDQGWVRERARLIEQSDTTAWRKIPWAASLLEALRLGRQEGRPVFLFTYDGNLDTGRC